MHDIAAVVDRVITQEAAQFQPGQRVLVWRHHETTTAFEITVGEPAVAEDGCLRDTGDEHYLIAEHHFARILTGADLDSFDSSQALVYTVGEPGQQRHDGGAMPHLGRAGVEYRLMDDGTTYLHPDQTRSAGARPVDGGGGSAVWIGPFVRIAAVPVVATLTHVPRSHVRPLANLPAGHRAIRVITHTDPALVGTRHSNIESESRSPYHTDPLCTGVLVEYAGEAVRWHEAVHPDPGSGPYVLTDEHVPDETPDEASPTPRRWTSDGFGTSDVPVGTRVRITRHRDTPQFEGMVGTITESTVTAGRLYVMFDTRTATGGIRSVNWTEVEEVLPEPAEPVVETAPTHTWAVGDRVIVAHPATLDGSTGGVFYHREVTATIGAIHDNHAEVAMVDSPFTTQMVDLSCLRRAPRRWTRGQAEEIPDGTHVRIIQGSMGNTSYPGRTGRIRHGRHRARNGITMEHGLEWDEGQAPNGITSIVSNWREVEEILDEPVVEPVVEPTGWVLPEATDPEERHTVGRIYVTDATSQTQRVGEMMDVQPGQRRSDAGRLWYVGTDGNFYRGLPVNPTVAVGDHVRVLGITGVDSAIGQDGVVGEVQSATIRVRMDDPDSRNNSGATYVRPSGWVVDEWVALVPGTPVAAPTEAVSVASAGAVYADMHERGAVRPEAGTMLRVTEPGHPLDGQPVAVYRSGYPPILRAHDGRLYNHVRAGVQILPEEVKAPEVATQEALDDYRMVLQAQWHALWAVTDRTATQEDWCSEYETSVRNIGGAPLRREDHQFEDAGWVRPDGEVDDPEDEEDEEVEYDFTITWTMTIGAGLMDRILNQQSEIAEPGDGWDTQSETRVELRATFRYTTSDDPGVVSASDVLDYHDVREYEDEDVYTYDTV